VKHIPLGIFAIVAIVGIMALLFSVSLVPEPAFMAVSIVGPSGKAFELSAGSNTIIVQLEVNEFLSNEITAVSETQLSGLRRGKVHGKEVSADFTQSLRFGEPALFNGGQVVFRKGETGLVSDFLEFQDAVFKYQVEFSPGLRSDVEGGALPDIEDEDIFLGGSTFTIVDTDVNTGSNSVSIKMFGGFGSIELTDNNYLDDNYQDSGAQVNGQNVHARVKIRAVESGNQVTIFSIQYVLDAESKEGGDLQVEPLHCVREYLQYPTGMFFPNFDICYKGLGGVVAGGAPVEVSGNFIQFRPRGDDEYEMRAPNIHGRVYPVPLAQLPGSYGNNGRDFVFVEAAAPGAPNIDLGDYLLVTSKDDVQGESRILRYNSFSGGVANFEDLATGSQLKASTSGAPPEGDLLAGQGTYHFVVGAGNSIAMDQTNNGAIAGNEARFRTVGGHRIDFGPGFTVTISTPSKLFDEPAGDETTDIDITFGGHIDLIVPSPQTTVPGYTFKMIGVNGKKQGLTKYGILFTLDTESESDRLDLTVPGAPVSVTKGGAGAEVYITLDRESLMRQPQQPVALPPPICGNRIITQNEYCDPPGSLCVDQVKRPGKCAGDCLSCIYTPPALCGNNLLENGEECEKNADCPAGFGCAGCKCMPLPPPVCGNDLLDAGEQCEKAVDCGPGYNCINCACAPLPPVVETPAAKPNIFVRFFLWLARLFGG
jgi:hypothetical protein